MEVTIKINNLTSSTCIVASEDCAYISVNQQRVNYDANNFLNKLFSITNAWNTPKKHLMIKDAESYEIVIVDFNKKTVLKGKSYQHLNYKDFKKLIREVTQ